MGIMIHWQKYNDERIETVFDPDNLFARSLTQKEVQGTICLRFIDPYGVTVFNYLQAEVFAEELDCLAEKVGDEEQRAHLFRIQTLARKCVEDTGTHLRFVGD